MKIVYKYCDNGAIYTLISNKYTMIDIKTMKSYLFLIASINICRSIL